MNTLMIKDLSNTEQLDSKAMSAVRGGNAYCYPMPSFSYTYAPVCAPNNSKTLTATQMINTAMNIQSANGNDSALTYGTTTNINPAIYSSNNIDQH
ncbi:hypothetical protein BTH42_29000 [Burkholderia sp. SRS-W-2-2016]|uniref:hypothetical protein n=1 Tax=Burkholderia sp. SRS-W-2-2016 TaxID=1926878 RepID=UPI00094AFA6C|nr:hypothetical protein [Burkholderia sp. SRS-W-2-2016]OLL28173.1 hypothetical protein BTH42_29000 [Burkholderia sp. SRS-W-2-2016]